MLLVAESIYEGTWASGPPPDEFIDFELMFEFHWSFHELSETPLYVKRFTWDLLQVRRQAEADQRRRDSSGK